MKISIFKSILFLLFFSSIQISNTLAQTNHYFVFFADKDQSPYSLENADEFLSQRSLDRRSKQGIPLDESDLPVNPNYIQELENVVVSIKGVSKWFNGALIEADPASISSVQNLSFVSAISDLSGTVDQYISIETDQDEEVSTNIYADDVHDTWGKSTTQLSMLNVEKMHENGYLGEGILMALCDNGYNGLNSNPYFEGVNIEGTWDFVNQEENVYNDNGSHGLNVLSTIAVNEPGDMVGIAPKTSFWLFKTESDSYELRLEELFWLFAAEKGDSVGIDILQSSLGYYDFDNVAQNYSWEDLNGGKGWITTAANFLSSKGVLVVVSAGNSGSNNWQKVNFPADSPFVLAVGSVNEDGIRATSSSVGPTEDGRIKPDIMAMGVGTIAVSKFGEVVQKNGTSFSAPLIAGLAAGLMQQFPEKSSQDIREVIIQSGDRLSDPNNEYGYGLANYLIASNTIVSSSDSYSQYFKDVIVYPNPLDGNKINISLPKELFGRNLKVTIYDLSGRKIMNEEFVIEKRKHQMEINSLDEKSKILFFSLSLDNKANKVVKIINN